MKKKATTVEALKERIERKRMATLRRDELKKALIPEVAMSINSLECERNEIRMRLSDVPDMPHFAERRANLQAQINQVVDAIEKARNRDDELRAELNELEYRTIPGTIQETMLADILPHQGEINEAISGLKRLEQLVSEQRAILQEANSAIAPIRDRSSERAELLASIAIGDAELQKLTDLDALIASERAEYAARKADFGPVIEQATQTIAGLENRIAEQRNAIAELQGQTPFVLEQYLNSEVARALDDYMQHASAVKNAFVRVVALEHLLKNVTGRESRIFLPRLLKLPCPTPAEYQSMVAAKNEPDVLFNADSFYVAPPMYEAAKNEIVEQMRGQGCNLL